MVALAKPTKAQLQQEARAHYIATANPIAIDGDARGAYAVLPSQSSENETHTVHFAEPRDRASFATHCDCDGYYFRKSCAHCEALNRYHKDIHEALRRPGTNELDAIVAQLEADFGLEEKAPVIEEKPAKRRRSLPNADLVAQLQVSASIKVRKARGKNVLSLSPRVVVVSPDCPAVKAA